MTHSFCLVIISLLCLTSSIQAIDEIPAWYYATADKPQSKAWYHDGSWWSILADGKNGSNFYKLSGDTWEKGELIDRAPQTRADVLSKGDLLFVLQWDARLPRFYKYSYDKQKQTYKLLSGFPVDLNVPEGHETMVIAEDSRGRLWVPFELGGTVRVIYSVSPDQREWNLKGVNIADGLKDDDIASIIAFDGCVGVLWSNQNTETLYFRVHRDADPHSR